LDKFMKFNMILYLQFGWLNWLWMGKKLGWMMYFIYIDEITIVVGCNKCFHMCKKYSPLHDKYFVFIQFYHTSIYIHWHFNFLMCLFNTIIYCNFTFNFSYLTLLYMTFCLCINTKNCVKHCFCDIQANWHPIF